MAIIVVLCVASMTYRYIQRQIGREQLSNIDQQAVNEVDIEDNKDIHKDIKTQRLDIPDDLRIHYYNDILISSKLSVGDYTDIRIRFENGMDFIILSKKLIVDLTPSGSDGVEALSLWIEVSEEEILRMSSAIVDGQLKGSKIYAIQYINELQKAAISNYPVIGGVRELIMNNPNIREQGKDVQEFHSRKEVEVLTGDRDILINDSDEEIVYLD